MEELARVGAAMERIAKVMETFLLWVKIVVIASLAYLVLTMLFAVIAIVTMSMSSGPMGF